MATPAPNPHKAARQHRKAYAVSRRIWSRLTTEQRTDPLSPAAVARLDEGTRLQLAIECDVPPLSAESWALCVEMIRDRVAEERRWRSLEERAS